MKFHGDINKSNFTADLQPLFNAMLAGNAIRSITFMAGSFNKNDPAKDITITDVQALDYWQGSGSSFSGELGRYVDVDYIAASPKNFYMDWVRSFTL